MPINIPTLDDVGDECVHVQDKQGNWDCLYTIVKFIGAGRTGRVILVQNNSDQRQIALKVVMNAGYVPHMQNTREEFKRYHAIRSPHIPNAIDYHGHMRLILRQTHRHLFRALYAGRMGQRSRITEGFTMEWCRGVTLADWKHMYRLQNKDVVITVMIQLLQALEDLHNAGWQHGDISLKNVIFDEQNKHVWLIDLGNALQIQEMRKQRDIRQYIRIFKTFIRCPIKEHITSIQQMRQILSLSSEAY